VFMRVEPTEEDSFYTDGYWLCDACGEVIGGVVWGEGKDLCGVCNEKLDQMGQRFMATK